ncbi:MAG: 30S ribosomal protein S28e [Nanoarchaeota archaeon]|nr:30S ribosomal protein S28e [Nanoarchaeota archaeon]MBU1622242.1 30S ribosomal protein S28e [Nanoarchaeota archaeon]
MVAKEDRGRKKLPEAGGKEGEIRFDSGIQSTVKEIVGRSGSRGEITQVMTQILEGRDKDKAIRRNVKGPVRIGDTLMLLETEIEAQRLGGGRRGKGKGSSSSSSKKKK